MGSSIDINKFIEENYSKEDFSHLNWSGSMQDYLDLVTKNPMVVRNSFQRVHDMIMSYGTSTYTEYKKEITRYHFFDDPLNDGKDAIFGIDVHLMKFVNFFKSAAQGYGTEKRVLLLHGPVGSAKSSISRLLKKGLEHYSKTDDGAIYTYEWHDQEASDILGGSKLFESPMHEEPLKLIPLEARQKLVAKLNEEGDLPLKLKIKGDVNPACRYILKEYITDGHNYYSADGKQTFKADEYYKVVEKSIKEGSTKLPITVSGDVAWVVAQTSPKHLRLTILDNGYINPEKSTAIVNFNNIKIKKITDILNNEEFKEQSSSVKINIPLGAFRFIDIELMEEL